MKTLNHGKYTTYNNHKCRCDECRKAWNAYVRPRLKAWRKENPKPSAKKAPNNQRTRKADRYQILFEKQNGVCAICKQSRTVKLDEDHCHITGQVRGLLCRTCNTGLGKLGDDPKRLQEAIDYLTIPPGSKVQIHLT